MLKKIYGLWLHLLIFLFGVDFAKQFDSYLRFRRKLNLKNPQTLADKVSYLFLHHSTPLMSACADKWAVREYLAQKGLAAILIPAAGGPWSNVDEIDFDALPNCFILKATHGCKMNYFVSDKSKLDISACKRTLQKWLNTTYGTYSVEPHYQDIPHRIYAEYLLGKPDQMIDYKFHCLNGHPDFILVISGRDASKARMSVQLKNLLDTSWRNLNQYLQTNKLKVSNSQLILPPQHLQQMLSVATVLSKDFPFVRVDLYEVQGKIYFGELTFSPAVGVFPSFTDEFIEKMGHRLILPKDRENEK